MHTCMSAESQLDTTEHLQNNHYARVNHFTATFLILRTFDIVRVYKQRMPSRTRPIKQIRINPTNINLPKARHHLFRADCRDNFACELVI